MQSACEQVWRGALLLADYVLAHAAALRGCIGIELGAGAGLAGLALAAAGARRVFLTDVGSAVLANCQVWLPLPGGVLIQKFTVGWQCR